MVGNIKKFYYIYKTTNIVNGKIYVGRHKTNNLNDGYIGCGLHNYNRSIRSKTHFGAAVRKYGYENFKREIIEFCDNDEHYIEREQYWIDHFRNENVLMYNMSQSSSGGFISEEAHEKAASKNRGKKRSQEFCDAVKLRMKGVKLASFSEEIKCEHCDFKSKNKGIVARFHNSNCLNNPNKEDISYIVCKYCGHRSRVSVNMDKYHGENCLKNPNLDLEHRKEIIKKYSFKSWKVWTDEMKKNLSDKKKGKKFSEEAKKNMKDGFLNGKRKRMTCDHCGYSSTNLGNIYKLHLENCLHAPVLSESAKLRLSKIEASKPKGILSDQIRKDISERMSNQRQVTCPFCLKTGCRTSMLRWHFENCKRKK